MGAVATRHYSFEEGTAGEAAELVLDSTTDLLIESDADGLWPTGHYWLEVSAATPRPLPAGGVEDGISEFGLAAPELFAIEGEATFADVSDGSEFDSPALGSSLALRFDGDAFYDDDQFGSKGIYVNKEAYENNDDVVSGSGDTGNTAESFNLITQGWVYPFSSGMESDQTVWQAGDEQGSVSITEDGFWEFRSLGSVGDLNPEIPVDFDAWTHLGIRRGGNGAEVYLNGELVAGDINPDPANFFNTFANVITLGGDREVDGLFFGLVDDFKVMGTADFTFDPAVDMDFFATDVVGCTPTNELLGDFDGVDGVSFADFLVLSGNFGNEVSSYAEGDVDCNGTVEFADFLALSANFGQTLGGAAAVPEPGGMTLLLPALLLLCLRKRNATTLKA